MEKMKYDVITDGRVLRAVAWRYMTDFDKRHKYCLTPSQCPFEMEYKGDKYRLKYFDGCFYPYLVRVTEAHEA